MQHIWPLNFKGRALGAEAWTRLDQKWMHLALQLISGYSSSLKDVSHSRLEVMLSSWGFRLLGKYPNNFLWGCVADVKYVVERHVIVGMNYMGEYNGNDKLL